MWSKARVYFGRFTGNLESKHESTTVNQSNFTRTAGSDSQLAPIFIASIEFKTRFP